VETSLKLEIVREAVESTGARALEAFGTASVQREFSMPAWAPMPALIQVRVLIFAQEIHPIVPRRRTLGRALRSPQQMRRWVSAPQVLDHLVVHASDPAESRVHHCGSCAQPLRTARGAIWRWCGIRSWRDVAPGCRRRKGKCLPTLPEHDRTYRRHPATKLPPLPRGPCAPRCSGRPCHLYRQGMYGV